MRTDIEERACDLAIYIIENRTTVRAAARKFGISKSTVHKDLSERLPLYNRPLYLQVKAVLEDCGVGEQQLAKFSVDYDEAFGFEAQLYPKNIIDDKKIQISTPDVIIKVAPDRSDLIQTRVIGGVKYLLINAEENVTVNGVDIHIAEKDEALI